MSEPTSTIALFREYRRLQAVALQNRDEASRRALHDFIAKYGIGAGDISADEEMPARDTTTKPPQPSPSR